MQPPPKGGGKPVGKGVGKPVGDTRGGMRICN
ncbi:MAG: hypothetical protein KatS3mg005_4120 [Bryobacteraceae bacterium]|nr:MAG: hypothetical protein KatS3mg005_4120 [Bryobacteraceae bacterium]